MFCGDTIIRDSEPRTACHAEPSITLQQFGKLFYGIVTISTLTRTPPSYDPFTTTNTPCVNVDDSKSSGHPFRRIEPVYKMRDVPLCFNFMRTYPSKLSYPNNRSSGTPARSGAVERFNSPELSFPYGPHMKIPGIFYPSLDEKYQLGSWCHLLAPRSGHGRKPWDSKKVYGTSLMLR